MSTVYTIDANGKKLGRVASEASSVLLGKNKTDFQKNIVSDTKVEIINVGKLNINESKKEGKEYTHYTGYPSGLRKKTMNEVIEKKGYEEIMHKAVLGMLPRNRLRDLRIKNLIIKA